MYLFIKNFKTKKPNKKLDHVKIGPFLIKKVKRPFDYELNLPADAKIFPMFNIFLLEPANPDTPLATTFRYHTEKKNEHEMEKILRRNGQNYFIRWKNCDETEDIWEPVKNFGNCQTFLRQFHQNRQRTNRNFQKRDFLKPRQTKKNSGLKSTCSANCFSISSSDIYAISLSTRAMFFFKTSTSRCKRLNLTKASLTFCAFLFRSFQIRTHLDGEKSARL